MMILSLILLALLAFALPAVALARRPAMALARREADIALSRRQLDELDADRARGLIADREAAAAKIEIERRILKIAERETAAGRRRRLPLAIPLLALLAAGPLALLLYSGIGRPDGWRDLAVPANETAATLLGPDAADAPEGEPTIAELLDTLEARLRDTPDRLDRWVLLGRTALNAGQSERAARAFSRASALAPDRADLHAFQGEALVVHGEGRVTPAADLAFAKALSRDPANPTALYFVGLGLLQNNRPEDAAMRWQTLLDAVPADAPFRPFVAGQLSRLRADLGQAPGPAISPEAAEAVAAMPADEQAAMIGAMVERLAERLRSEPEDIDGWIRLARSYRVLGNEAGAEAALRSAREHAPADRLEEIDRLLGEHAP